MDDISAGKVTRTILLEFRNIRKVANLSDKNKDKRELVKTVFSFDVGESNFLSLQRFDSDWGEYVDVETDKIRDRDKVKVCIIEQPEPSPTSTASKGIESVPGNSIDKVLTNLKDDREALDYKLNVALATLSSLKEIPKARDPIGRNTAFTCSNCHFRGHRANLCQGGPCEGYFMCGLKNLHREYRDDLKQAENEVKDLQKKIKQNIDEVERTNILKERTRTNFFAIMRKRLQSENPIKYSSRVSLDNDLRILAIACKHIAPAPSVNNLEGIIENYKHKASSCESSSFRESQMYDPWSSHCGSTTKTQSMHLSTNEGLLFSSHRAPSPQWDHRNWSSGGSTGMGNSQMPWDTNTLSSPRAYMPPGYHVSQPPRHRSASPRYSPPVRFPVPQPPRHRPASPRYSSPVRFPVPQPPRYRSPLPTVNRASPRHSSPRSPWYGSPMSPKCPQDNRTFFGPVTYNSSAHSVYSPGQEPLHQSNSNRSTWHSQNWQGKYRETSNIPNSSPRYHQNYKQHPTRKRLSYNESSSRKSKISKTAKARTAEELGRQFRASLNPPLPSNSQQSVNPSSTNPGDPMSDDDTQDIPSQEVNSQDVGQAVDEDSQAFDFSQWAQEQKDISKDLSNTADDIESPAKDSDM